MQRRETGQASNVIDLDAVRERRKFIALAHADEGWRNVKASFALSDQELDNCDAELAGRLLAGVITVEQGIEEIVRELGLTDRERPTEQNG